MTQTFPPASSLARANHSRLPPVAGWRLGLRVLLGLFILYIAVWIVRVIMGVGPNMLMRWFGAGPDVRAYLGSTLNYGVGITSYILFSAVAVRKVLSVNPWPIFFPAQRGWWKDLARGFLLVSLILALFFIFEVQAGWLVVESWRWQTMQPDAWLRALWVGLLVNIGVAIGEETIFRGYLLSGLKTALGKWPGLIVMMVIFGLFHLPAYMESGGMRSWTLTLAILLATLFGALFGLVYLRTGSLWLPVGLHFTWNFVENDLLNLAADSTNPNLIGALTRFQNPLSMNANGWGSVIVLEMLAFGLIALSTWLWLRHRYKDGTDLAS